MEDVWLTLQSDDEEQAENAEVLEQAWLEDYRQGMDPGFLVLVFHKRA